MGNLKRLEVGYISSSSFDFWVGINEILKPWIKQISIKLTSVILLKLKDMTTPFRKLMSLLYQVWKGCSE